MQEAIHVHLEQFQTLTNIMQQDRLTLQLQCGSIICPQTSSRCNNIHDELNIGKLIYKQLAVIIILSFYRLFNEKLSDREDLYSLRVSTQHLYSF